MRRGAGLLVLAVVVTGCTHGPTPSPPPELDAARPVAAQLAAAIQKKDLSPVTFAGATGAQTDALFQPLVRGMGPLTPQVDVTAVNGSGAGASATLAYRWTFPGVPQPWTYDTTVQLTRDGGTWRPTWSPALVQPSLDGTNRLSQHRLRPERGELLGEDGDPVVERRPVVRIGLDKANVAAAKQESSAKRLARLVGIDPATYVRLVSNAGDQAFVPAIVFRAKDPQRPSNAQVFAIPGALPIEDDAMLPPTRDFASALIGRVGPATAEVVKASDGTVVDGDEVGLSGLQKRYDDTMSGTPGVAVQLVAGSSPSASPTPAGGTASPGGSASASLTSTLFEVKAEAGKPLETTLVVGLQRLAEKTLAKTSTAASLVAIRPSTGAVLAAADNAAADGQPVATFGQVQPGSTFKVVSALALLRSGLTPSSRVDCPRTTRVGGRTYENYDDYPASHLGRIDLATAFAQSCNTAFIGLRDRLKGTDLADAAASLGIGTDYDVGFPAAFGSVATGGSANARAEAIFGQGKDQVSPLAMALATASVEAGRTVLPTLVVDHSASSKAAPLTKGEAATLRTLMRGVVTEGSGRRLAGLDGPAVIAKTGTAEYGGKTPPKTHAWMIAAQGDLAVAVYVQDGSSGSGTAGPLLEAFLRGAR